MGVMRKLVPVSRVTVALWAWRHRREILDWGSFAVRSAPRLVSGESDEVVAEGKIRMALARDGRTRTADVDVSVENGAVRLTGRAPDEATHRALLDVAGSAAGQRRVRDEVRTDRGRRLRR